MEVAGDNQDRLDFISATETDVIVDLVSNIPDRIELPRALLYLIQ